MSSQIQEPNGVRPKRQRPIPSLETDNSAFNDAPEEDLGFYNEVSFPDISEFGLGWDPQRLRRRKREARNHLRPK